jgi:hypothetical protein
MKASPSQQTPSGGSDHRLVRGLPQRVVKSRKPSPVAKSGITSTFREDVTVEQHAEDIRQFITANSEYPHPELGDPP